MSGSTFLQQAKGIESQSYNGAEGRVWTRSDSGDIPCRVFSAS